MSLRRFNADVRAARLQLDDPGIPGVMTIERGDSEGEAKITFVHEKLDGPLSVRLLAHDLDAYPENSDFLLFTDTDEIPPVVVSALEELQVSTLGHSVLQCVHDVSATLFAALSSVDADGDITLVAGEDGAIYDDDEDHDWDDLDENYVFGLPSTARTSPKSNANTSTPSAILEKLKEDLRVAREAGCRVGILKGLKSHATAHNISISMRASKMGLSDETLEAWDVEPSDYIVLLIAIDERYQPADRLLLNASSAHMQFRFGRCSKYKPSCRSATDAFQSPAPPTSTTKDTATDQPETTPFSRLFISESLDRFMNEDFINLVKTRLRGSESWDDANLRLHNLVQTHSPTFSGDVDSDSEDHEAGGGEEEDKDQSPHPSEAHKEDSAALISRDLLPDPFTSPPDSISLPLAAMHFATHYFTRCTEYCLRCHRRLPRDFEALKPFVCSNPLCLFQYMAMGLGPSIEHEILTQPYVVDLLVSLCYSSVVHSTHIGAQCPIREFPVGLHLKGPRIPFGLSGTADRVNAVQQATAIWMPVKGDLQENFLAALDSKDLHHLKPNTFAMLQQPALNERVKPLLHQVRIKHVDRGLNRITFDLRHQDLPPDPELNPCFNKTMAMIPYDVDFDDLSEHEKALTICMLLNSLPPIAHLQKYLFDHPGGSLSSYTGIFPAARTLLQWIVASNRSCILQVSPAGDDEKLSLQGTKSRPQEQIPGVNSGYVQFRFAQGSPDKELRFQRALNELGIQKTKKHPTIFAWHGSKLSNWHSILRQGLDYNQVQNGRAFGDGVYFSRDYHTSATYAKTADCWPRSALQPTQVMSLCEIINATESFISTTPHYVVPNVDWIQCRYLFVQRTATIVAGNNDSQNDGGLAAAEEIAQDPKRPVLGPNGKILKIPIKALPSSRTTQQHMKGPRLPTKRGSDMIVQDTDTDEEEIADVNALESHSGSSPPRLKRLCIKDAAEALEPSVEQPMDASMTDFKPGTLNLSSLPRLALPQWANPSSTKRLAAEIKRLQEIQTTTPLHELGWYIHTDNIENMFRWIVELHSFDPELPLARDMKQAGISSVVLEVRFGRDYPFSPPFVRVIRPRFLPFMEGGGK